VSKLWKTNPFRKFADNSLQANVTSLSFFDASSKKEIKLEGLEQPVSIAFMIPRTINATFNCSYWDFEKLIWSQKGCSLLTKQYIENYMMVVVCGCTHLTDFGMEIASTFKDSGFQYLDDWYSFKYFSFKKVKSKIFSSVK